MARRKSYYKKLKKASPQSIILAIIFLILAVAGYYVYNKYFKEEEPFIEAKGAISFHFMTLGNGASGDCIYVKAGEYDILIDAGSREDSVDDIQSYVNQYVKDNKLEFVIITHADEDHIAGFAADNSIFDLYKCEIIIDFPLTNKALTTEKGNPTLYAEYIDNRTTEIENDSATHYTALECYNNKNGAKSVYNLSEDGNVKMEILYNYYYFNKDDGNDNNHSVCIMFYHGSRKFLFTGDLEKSGEEKFVEFYENNNSVLSQVELFKAGHHGSKTSSNDFLLKYIQPKVCVICCAAGAHQYNALPENRFPTQLMVDRIAKYTEKVFVTTLADPNYVGENEFADMNGDIVVTSDEETGVTVKCSNNDTLLKDTAWFINNRTMPDEWKTAA